MGFVRNRMENTHLTIVRNSPYSLFIKVHFNDTFLPYSISRNLYSFQRKLQENDAIEKQQHVLRH